MSIQELLKLLSKKYPDDDIAYYHKLILFYDGSGHVEYGGEILLSFSSLSDLENILTNSG